MNFSLLASLNKIPLPSNLGNRRIKPYFKSIPIEDISLCGLKHCVHRVKSLNGGRMVAKIPRSRLYSWIYALVGSLQKPVRGNQKSYCEINFARRPFFSLTSFFPLFKKPLKYQKIFENRRRFHIYIRVNTGFKSITFQMKIYPWKINVYTRIKDK